MASDPEGKAWQLSRMWIFFSSAIGHVKGADLYPEQRKGWKELEVYLRLFAELFAHTEQSRQRS